ncbi:RNA polymerase sigma factor SigJ [Massilia sp. erpn]|uniref:RNA polymerase sigma factor SigJ n=1 Tax=Massilia sp. erpn TaxID=2738142 RepID=UPI00210479B7|nr:RNA polymerase sigma factor SigJ [Massilia sp. erpn]UTY60085.1 RNA polymerase sigma factor SigJ [Massilia sp. erpn]
MSAADGLAEFQPHTRYMKALAYRMLGSRAEAEDVVQEAWLRWHGAQRTVVENPRAFLARTVTHLCLDQIKSAQVRREVYIGTWLPEPLVDAMEEYQPGPEAAHELAHDLSFAFMLALERLSPLERAAFLLHDIFGQSFAEIAATLERSEAACRQLAARARGKLQQQDRKASRAPQEGERLAAAFAAAVRDGDIDALSSVLAADARFFSDGGGKVEAVPHILFGRELVAKVILGFSRQRPEGMQLRPATVNGLPGFVLLQAGRVIQTLALQAGTAGEIESIYITRNPDKLQQVAA